MLRIKSYMVLLDQAQNKSGLCPTGLKPGGFDNFTMIEVLNMKQYVPSGS